MYKTLSRGQQNKMYMWSEKLSDSQHTSSSIYKMLSPVMFKLLKQTPEATEWKISGDSSIKQRV